MSEHDEREPVLDDTKFGGDGNGEVHEGVEDEWEDDEDDEDDDDDEGDDDEPDIVLLTDDDGNEREFAIIHVLTVAGRDYAVLVPADADDEEDEDDEDDEGVILRIEEVDGEDTLVAIEDEAEFQRVVAALDAAEA